MELNRFDGTEQISRAADLLDITEFRLFQIAYRRWFGRRAGDQRMEWYFANYMFHDIEPPWVRHLAREILEREQAGTLRGIDYGVRPARLDPGLRRRGRLYAAVLSVICLLLLLAALSYDQLVQFVENCYFPPCY
jgi:hypothetical protein